MYGVGGAASRPMAWAGGGSTKPPMVNNYLDSHGLNAGLGNSSHTQFPSVVDTKPMQVHISKYFRISIEYFCIEIEYILILIEYILNLIEYILILIEYICIVTSEF